ncbi:MAG: alpha-2-macroglobulin family protein [Burkholderiales bacterium]|nr:MAG: alpha-2-macroglobulin family protein [Burkholderiales bacterium]
MPRRPVVAALAVVAAVVAVVMAVFGWRAGPPGDAPATAGDAVPAAFGLADCRPRLFDGSPAVAVMFTRPLKRSQDWAKLLQATEGEDASAATPVPARWVLGDNPRVLYLPNATPERTYRIRIDAGLASTDEASLPVAQTCTVKSEAMPEAFHFASRGVVLPAGQNGGLPVVTVNVPEVDVQFLRVKPDAWAAFLQQVGGRREPSADEDGDPEASNPDSRLKGRVGIDTLEQLRASADLVHAGRFATDPRPNRRTVSFLQVERIEALKEPGLYVAVMNPPGRFAYDYQVTHFHVTDIGLHARRRPAQTDVFATSLKTGTALRDVEVSAIDAGGRSIAQARTDAQGRATFAGGLDKARAIVARQGRQLSLLGLRDPALDLSEYDVAGHPSREQKLFVWAGRDLYRPGETFQASVLARDADGRPLPAPPAAGSAAGSPPLTLTLKRPDGDVALTRLVRAHSTGTGYYQQAIVLPADAPTGRWLLELRTDPGSRQPVAQWPFQVEEFLPERMKLDLAASEAALAGDASLSVAVSGDYLYGAPAAGNRLLGSVATERQRNPLPQAWPGFVFGDADDDAARKRADLEEATLDEAGRAQVTVPVDVAERRSPMRVRASFSLLESGGRPVVRSIERTWWPAPVLIGVRPLFDRDVAREGAAAGFEVVRTDAAGTFVPARDVQVRLLREERRWYWRYDEGRGWNGGHLVEEELVEARTLALAARSTLSLPVGWGRYRLELHDPATGQTMRYRFYAGWGAQDADDVGMRPDRVQLRLEGAPFAAGAVAKLTVMPPHDGDALVTVEGDRVLFARRIPVRASGTTIEIPVDASWNRHDLYVGVVAFRPGSEGDRVTPARALGLAHLPLARDARRMKLEITAPAKTTPEQSVPVRLRLADAAGRPPAAGSAIVTVSAVDVGILNITRYASPDPAGFFFGKHRYEADLLDLYGKLIEKMEGTVARQRFGGDAAMRDTQSLPRRVRLVDLFSGPVAVDARGEATVPLRLPDFNGTLRLMAVAATADGYASAETEMTVAAPLVAELAMPRFVSPGDSAAIALDVTNLSGAAQTVTVRLEAGAPLRIVGSPGPVKLADGQRTVLRYLAEPTEAEGLAPIRVTVTAGSIRLVREAALQVQPATAAVRQVRRLRLEPGAVAKLDPGLAEGLWPGTATVGLSLSGTPPIDVRDAVRGLLSYPYGCLEQTTSSAYPLVFVDEAGAAAVGLSPLSREEREARLLQAFGRLAGMQQPQGGFGLWGAGGPYEGWLSAYVSGFLQDARDAGFAVPARLQQRAADALLERLQRSPALQQRAPREAGRDAQGRPDPRELDTMREAHQRFAEAAHAGYVLAREQRAPLATLRTLHDTWRANARSPLPLVHLGLALRLMGDEARAAVALDEAMARPYGLGASEGGDAGAGEWLGDYGSPIRDLALSYALMLRHQAAHPRREVLLETLARSVDRRRYLSTQERLALFMAARAAGGSGRPWSATLQAGAAPETLTASRGEQRSWDVAALRRGITVTNTSADPLFLELAVAGHPLKPPVSADDAIAIERAWFTADGKALAPGRTLRTGELLVVRLRATSRQRIRDGLVVDRIPAGVEVENRNLSQGPGAGDFKVDGVNVAEAMADGRIRHVEYRDDRFVAAAEIGSERLQLFYTVRVVTPGRFVVPSAFAEDMYRPELRGVGRAEPDLVVVDPRAPAAR